MSKYRKRAQELVAQMTLEEKVSQTLYNAPAIERLGIPAYNWWNEALHGVARAGTATVFPQAIGVAATFDEDLAGAMAEVIAEEGRAKYNAQKKAGDRDIYKGLTFWAPNVNIFRDPRWGRGQETYGEDPYLTSRLGVRFVEGLQGDDPDYMKTAACAKHFAVHSGPESLRHSFDAKASKQDMYETYLPAFKACVQEAKVEAVMGAYNRTNGEPCCGSKTLLQDILRDRYRLVIDYAKAGSIDMVTDDAEGRDFLFPSNQTALELYKQVHGDPVKSEIILNTPIVLYTRSAVAQALVDSGLAAVTNGVYTVDMENLTETIEAGTTWEEIGLPQLYGSVSVGTTDPTKSNSGNMFAGLLANTLCGGVADESNLAEILPRLQNIFQKLGYMESSSSDLFDQFLKTGMGAKPLIAGYENQLLEFAVENPDTWEQIKGDIVIMYPTPTVWSSHVYIALDEAGTAGIDALLDEDIQRLAWEKHGFRTGVYDTPTDAARFGVSGIAEELTQVAPMPDANTMDRIIKALS